MAVEIPDDPLIFTCERRGRSRWRLAAMIALSLLVHAGSFYALQVAYTPTGSQLPPPAQVVVVPVDQPEYAPLARWITMNDPALMVRSATPAAADVIASLGFAYVPSYAANPPGFRPLDADASATVIAPPSPNLPGPVPAPALPWIPAKNAPAAGPVSTRIVFSGAVGPAPETLPAVTFVKTQNTRALDPTTFLVGLREHGGEPYLFRQASSGDAEADEYARSYLAKLPALRQPREASAGVSWGAVSFYWGSAVYGLH